MIRELNANQVVLVSGGVSTTSGDHMDKVVNTFVSVATAFITDKGVQAAAARIGASAVRGALMGGAAGIAVGLAVGIGLELARRSSSG